MAKVLLAEDEPALREILCVALQELGHECILAVDGIEALDKAREHLPQVIVTDHMMPRRSGGDLMRLVQDDPRLRDIPVILLSAGRPTEEDRARAWRFLPKC